MPAGRPTKPREVKAMQGTLQKCRDNGVGSIIGNPIEPGDVYQRCQIPGIQGSPKRARVLYFQLCKKVAAWKILEEVDCIALLRYANYVHDWIECNKAIAKEGYLRTVKNKDGEDVKVKNPLLAVRTDVEINMRTIESRFGFSPLDRQKLKLSAGDGEPKGFQAIFAAAVVRSGEGNIPKPDDQGDVV